MHVPHAVAAPLVYVLVSPRGLFGQCCDSYQLTGFLTSTIEQALQSL